MVKHGRVLQFFFLASIGVTGCSRSPAPAYPDWTQHDVAVPSTGSFQLYIEAAAEAEHAAPELCDRVSFVPKMKLEAISKLKHAVSTLQKAARTQAEFPFMTTPPTKAPPYQRGWRLLGRVLAWRIERAIAEGRPNDTVLDATVAARFGFELCGGSATDASLGLEIVQEAVQAIAPALDKLNARSLEELAKGLGAALDTRTPLAQTITNEERNMLTAVQWVQDCYRRRQFDRLSSLIGPDSREAVAYLKDLEAKDRSERPGYFQGFADEAHARVRWLQECAKLPAASRPAEPDLKNVVRPWKRFSKHFFETCDPLLELCDLTLARVRLCIMESLIRLSLLKNKSAPESLDTLPHRWAVDPYSGKPFIYRAEGMDYRIYSVGANLEDDGGDTDDTGTSPDLVLNGEG